MAAAARPERHRDPADRIRERDAAHARTLLMAEHTTIRRVAAAEALEAATAADVARLTATARPRPPATPAVARAATARAVRLAGCSTAVGLCLRPDYALGGRVRGPDGPPFSSRHGPA